MQGINNYSYHVFGIIIVAILFFKYLIKSLFTVPKSVDQGQITSHILALKTGVLILFPTYVEYYDYCSGFMVADFPWANSDIGAAVSN